MDEELLAKLRKAAIIGSFFALAIVFAFLRWQAALKVYVVLIGLFATLAILIQSGKGGGLAASLGGLGGESLLGVRSATPIAKATYVMLALFLFICMLIAIIGPGEHRGAGLMEKMGQTTSQPTIPETPALPLPAGGGAPPAQPPAEQPAPEQPAPEQPAAAQPANAAPEAPAAPAAPAPSSRPGGTQQP